MIDTPMRKKYYSMHVYHSLPKLEQPKNKPTVNFSLAAEKVRYDRLFTNKRQIEAIKKEEYEQKKRLLKQRVQEDLMKMDNDIASINELVQLKMSVSRKLQILDHNPKIEFERLREYPVFKEDYLSNRPQLRSSKQESDEVQRRKYLRQRFKETVVSVANKLKRFKLKPHEVLSNQLFSRTPYVMGKQIFKRVLQDEYQEVWKIVLRNRKVIYTFNQLMQTPLICAAVRGHLKILRLLLENQSDIDHMDSLGNTAAYYASKYGHTDCLVQLIIECCNLERRNKNGDTAGDVSPNELIRNLVKVGRRVHSVLVMLEPEKRQDYFKNQCILFNIHL